MHCITNTVSTSSTLYSYTYLIIYLFVHSFICLFIYSFILYFPNLFMRFCCFRIKVAMAETKEILRKEFLTTKNRRSPPNEKVTNNHKISWQEWQSISSTFSAVYLLLLFENRSSFYLSCHVSIDYSLQSMLAIRTALYVRHAIILYNKQYIQPFNTIIIISSTIVWCRS